MRFGGISSDRVRARSRSGGAVVAVRNVLTESPPHGNVWAVTPNVTIRPVRAGEWRLVRDVRLRSLADSPEAFGAWLADESTMPDAVWIERTEGSARGGAAAAFIAEAGPVGSAS